MSAARRVYAVDGEEFVELLSDRSCANGEPTLSGVRAEFPVLGEGREFRGARRLRCRLEPSKLMRQLLENAARFLKADGKASRQLARFQMGESG